MTHLLIQTSAISASRTVLAMYVLSMSSLKDQSAMLTYTFGCMGISCIHGRGANKDYYYLILLVINSEHSIYNHKLILLLEKVLVVHISCTFKNLKHYWEFISYFSCPHFTFI